MDDHYEQQIQLLSYALLTDTDQALINKNFVFLDDRNAIFPDLKWARIKKGSIKRSLDRYRNSQRHDDNTNLRYGEKGNVIDYTPLPETFSPLDIIVHKPGCHRLNLPQFAPFYSKQFRPSFDDDDSEDDSVDEGPDDFNKVHFAGASIMSTSRRTHAKHGEPATGQAGQGQVIDQKAQSPRVEVRRIVDRNDFGAIATINQDQVFNGRKIDLTIELLHNDNGIGSSGYPFYILSGFTQRGGLSQNRVDLNTFFIFSPVLAHSKMIMCMDPEHHPVLADDGRSIILHLKDDHDEQYLLGLLDNFSEALAVRVHSNGEGLMHAFFATVKHLKDTMMGVHNVKRDEKIICLRLKLPKKIVCDTCAFQDRAAGLAQRFISPEYVHCGYPYVGSGQMRYRTPLDDSSDCLRFGFGFFLPAVPENSAVSLFESRTSETTMMARMRRLHLNSGATVGTNYSPANTQPSYAGTQPSTQQSYVGIHQPIGHASYYQQSYSGTSQPGVGTRQSDASNYASTHTIATDQSTPLPLYNSIDSRNNDKQRDYSPPRNDVNTNHGRTPPPQTIHATHIASTTTNTPSSATASVANNLLSRVSGIFGSGGPRVGTSGDKKGVSFQDEMEDEASHQQDPTPTKPPSRKGRFYDGQVLQHINRKGVQSIVTVVQVHDDEDFPHYTVLFDNGDEIKVKQESLSEIQHNSYEFEDGRGDEHVTYGRGS